MSSIPVIHDVEGTKAAMEKFGAICVPRKLSPERDETFYKNFNKIAVDLFNEYESKALEIGDFGLGKHNGFRELVMKDLGRYDVNLDHLLDVGRELTPLQKSMVEMKDYVREVLDPHLKIILGEQYVDNAVGMVMSKPGTEPQGWHVDVSHMFAPFEFDPTICLPCHFVTVLCPLYEFCEEIGPTEVALGSHKYTTYLNNRDNTDQYPTGEMLDFILSRSENDGLSKCKMNCNIGDIAIMDARVLHRGLDNRSDVYRPLLYFSFCRPFYREWPRSQNDGRPLFPQ